mmetsp:Transcript_14676/g.26655  ORF Transcript_14676/g.26655 Transcript_14676/m.26655 type:complete len:165 (+) Transcript_14676:88-582(+)
MSTAMGSQPGNALANLAAAALNHGGSPSQEAKRSLKERDDFPQEVNSPTSSTHSALTAATADEVASATPQMYYHYPPPPTHHLPPAGPGPLPNHRSSHYPPPPHGPYAYPHPPPPPPHDSASPFPRTAPHTIGSSPATPALTPPSSARANRPVPSATRRVLDFE